MKNNLHKCSTPTSNQGGFTLIELVVVVAIIGVLISIVAPNVIGSKDGANSQLMLKSSSSIAENWSLINQSCGTSTAIAGNPIPDAGKTVSDVIFGGVANVAAAYQNCYTQSKVLALTEISQPTAVAGVYSIAGYSATLAGGGTALLQIGYLLVPDSLTLLMAQKYNSTLSALAADDTTSPVVQYSTVTAGTRTVTIFKQI